MVPVDTCHVKLSTTESNSDIKIGYQSKYQNKYSKTSINGEFYGNLFRIRG
jgi:hypothetical protein